MQSKSSPPAASKAFAGSTYRWWPATDAPRNDMMIRCCPASICSVTDRERSDLPFLSYRAVNAPLDTAQTSVEPQVDTRALICMSERWWVDQRHADHPDLLGSEPPAGPHLLRADRVGAVSRFRFPLRRKSRCSGHPFPMAPFGSRQCLQDRNMVLTWSNGAPEGLEPPARCLEGTL
jgi:hypothetical protein